jgi:hypothetical protein
VPFEDRHCSSLRNCYVCNAAEEACVLWSAFLISSLLHASIGSTTHPSDSRGLDHDCAGTHGSCRFAGHNQRDFDIILNGSCDAVALQVVVRGATEAGSDFLEPLGFGFSSIFSLEPFNSAAIESCNRAAHSHDIARALHVGDAFADVVFIVEGVRFPAHKVGVASTRSLSCVSIVSTSFPEGDHRITLPALSVHV